MCLREIPLKKDIAALQSQMLYRGCSIMDDVIKRNFIVHLYRKDGCSTISTDGRLDSVPGIRRGSCAQITHSTENPVEKQKSTPNTLYCYVSVQAGHVYS